MHSNIFERILQISKVNDAWQFFKTEYLFICNKNAPLREIRVKHHFNPWFSNEIQQAIYERNRLHKLSILKKSVELFKEFTRARNKVTSLVRQAKRKFYSDHLSNNNTSSDRMWKLLKEFLPNKKGNTISALKDPQTFNDFFFLYWEKPH